MPKFMRYLLFNRNTASMDNMSMLMSMHYSLYNRNTASMDNMSMLMSMLTLISFEDIFVII